MAKPSTSVRQDCKVSPRMRVGRKDEQKPIVKACQIVGQNLEPLSNDALWHAHMRGQRFLALINMRDHKSLYVGLWIGYGGEQHDHHILLTDDNVFRLPREDVASVIKIPEVYTRC